MKQFLNVLKVYGRSLSILASERLLAGALVFAGICVAIIQLLEPILFGRVIDSLSRSQNTWQTLGVWAGLGLVNVLASVFQAVMSDRLAHRQRLTVMGEAFETALGLPVSFHAEQGSGRVVRALLAGTDQLFGLWLAFMREHLSSMVGILVLVPTAIAMDYRLAILLFSLAVVYMIGNSVVLRKTQGRQAHVESFHQDLFGRVGDVLGNITVVQSYTRLVDETEALQQIMSRLLRAQYPVLTWWGLLTVLTRVSATLTMVSILGVGSYLASRGEITVGEIVAFTGFAGLLIAKLDQISAFVYRATTQAPTLQTFFDLFDRESGVVDQPGAVPLTQARGHVHYKKVSYQYSGKPAGVYDLDFEATPGMTIALVGPSGSGKTTTLALLQRMFDPQSGEIHVDGHDLRHYTVSTLRHAMATVFQDAGLFNRSIAENIRVGRPLATDEEVEAAAKGAEAHGFILSKPGGYHFVIGERGSALSGGERQRIAIARAILKKAPILILDEATSALDNETERKIQRALDHVRRDKTTFIIAHRLSTVISADLILVFDHGRIVEKGTFQQLKEAGGLFTRLVRAGELDSNPQELK